MISRSAGARVEDASAQASQTKLYLHLTARLLQMLTDLRGKLGLDAENLHILSAFCVAQLAEQRRAGGGDRFEISASTLSEMTLIPRQTIRRRLDGLCQQGYVQALGAGRYTAGALLANLDLPERVAAFFPKS